MYKFHSKMITQVELIGYFGGKNSSGFEPTTFVYALDFRQRKFFYQKTEQATRRELILFDSGFSQYLKSSLLNKKKKPQKKNGTF